MSKFTKYLQIALLLISAVVIVLFYSQNSSADFSIENMSWVMSNTSMVDGIIMWTYALVVAAIALVFILSLVGMVKNPKSLKRTGFTLLLTVVIVGLSYVLASGDPVVANIDKQPTATALKLTDTGLIITYILLAASILSIAVGGVINSIKNR